MDKPLLVLKPGVVNALLPTLVKNLFIIGILSGVYFLLGSIELINKSSTNMLFGLLCILLVYFTLRLVIKLIILYNTKYFFFQTNVVREFELVIVRRHSTPYNQIVNITSHVSLWDRLCKAGDITLHTAEDRLPDLVLHYIDDPEKIEKDLYELIQKSKKIYVNSEQET